MPNIIFRGSEIRDWDGCMDDDGNVFTRIKIRADWSAPVAEQMGWGEIPEGLSAGNLTGALRARTVALTPADKALKAHALELEVTEVRNFRFVGSEDKDGVGHQFLVFQVVSPEIGACGKVENYMRLVGRAGAQLRCSYEQQQDLELNAATSVGERVDEEGGEDDAPVAVESIDNALNSLGSGRTRRKRTRGEMSAAAEDPNTGLPQVSEEVLQ